MDSITVALSALFDAIASDNHRLISVYTRRLIGATVGHTEYYFSGRIPTIKSH